MKGRNDSCGLLICVVLIYPAIWAIRVGFLNLFFPDFVDWTAVGSRDRYIKVFGAITMVIYSSSQANGLV